MYRRRLFADVATDHRDGRTHHRLQLFGGLVGLGLLPVADRSVPGERRGNLTAYTRARHGIQQRESAEMPGDCTGAKKRREESWQYAEYQY